MFAIKHRTEFNTSFKLKPLDMKRFMDKIIVEGDCWVWQGRLHRLYGTFYIAGKSQWAHRVSYFLFKGEIPAHHVVDHMCRNPSCVNPEHLQAVTLAGNAQLIGWRRRDEHNLRLPFAT